VTLGDFASGTPPVVDDANVEMLRKGSRRMVGARASVYISLDCYFVVPIACGGTARIVCVLKIV
jgi:hypothetical protein